VLVAVTRSDKAQKGHSSGIRIQEEQPIKNEKEKL
jgi:hypothetical protein